MRHSPHSNRQTGASAIIAVIAVVVVSATALTGWYVLQKNKSPTASNNTIQSPQDEKNAQSIESSEDDKYLVIKEWGVKIPLSHDIAGAYYVHHARGLNETVEFYDVAFDALKNADGVSCSDTKYFFYVIARAKPENVAVLSEGPGAAYREFSFTKEWMFGGLGAHQASPSCAFIGSDLSQEDLNILDAAEKKEAAFNTAFDKLQPSE
jgi:hypothetical protein